MKYKDYKQLTDEQKEELEYKYTSVGNKYFTIAMSCYIISFIFIAALGSVSLGLLGGGVEGTFEFEGEAESLLDTMFFTVDIFLVFGWVCTILQWVTLFKKRKFLKQCKEDNEDARK